MPSRDSIDKLSKQAVRGIRKHLKSLGIEVPEVDGPSNETHLGALQELQAIEGALDGHVSKQTESRVTTWSGDTVTNSTASYPAADTMDSTSDASTSTGKKAR